MIETMNIEWTELTKLKTDQQNPNSMNAKQKEALKKNIQKFGWNMPIITDMNYLIADGEQKLIVAKELGLNKVPVLRKDLTDTERRIIRQSMNKLRGQHSLELDAAEFKKILEQINIEDFNGLTAISEQDILSTLSSLEKEDKEIIGQVDKLYVQEVTCPKCGFKFKKEEGKG